MDAHAAAYEHHRFVIDCELRAMPDVSDLAVFVWSSGQRSTARRSSMNVAAGPAGTVPVVVYVSGKPQVVHHRIGGA